MAAAKSKCTRAAVGLAIIIQSNVKILLFVELFISLSNTVTRISLYFDSDGSRWAVYFLVFVAAFRRCAEEKLLVSFFSFGWSAVLFVHLARVQIEFITLPLFGRRFFFRFLSSSGYSISHLRRQKFRVNQMNRMTVD